jgi:hypothetical protein
MKARLVGKGKNKNTGGGKGHTRPSMKRTLSAPPLEEDDEIEETSAPAFLSGEKPHEQACYEDPNCRELQKKKKKKTKVYMEPHMHQDSSDEELEELSAMSMGSVEGHADSRSKRDEDDDNETLIRHEHFINDVINYLLRNGS